MGGSWSQFHYAPTIVSSLQQNLISVQIIGTWPVQIIETLRSQKLEDLQILEDLPTFDFRSGSIVILIIAIIGMIIATDKFPGHT